MLPKSLQEKIKKMSDELGGINSYLLILENGGASIATFDGTLEETCENLAEGFDFFIKKAVEDGLTQKECTEIQQSLQESQIETIAEISEPKITLTLVK
jgi:predicted RNase H-like HicB family nuclease